MTSWRCIGGNELAGSAMSWFQILTRMIAKRSRQLGREATFEVFRLDGE